jgi:hypothetical protein
MEAHVLWRPWGARPDRPPLNPALFSPLICILRPRPCGGSTSLAKIDEQDTEIAIDVTPSHSIPPKF